MSNEIIKLKCPYCGKVLQGWKTQAEHNLAVHIVSHHKDKISLKEGKQRTK